MAELRELGLTEYEIRVYETLLKLESAKGGEIAKKSRVPHGKTYEALHSLAERGLIRIVPVKPKLFRIIDPEKGLQNLIDLRTQEMEEIKESVIASLKPVKKPRKKPVELVSVVAGHKPSFQLFHQMAGIARKQVWVYSRGERVPAQTYRDMDKLIKRGIDHRLIVFELDENREDVKIFCDRGVNLRYYPGGAFSLVVRDGEESFISIRNPFDIKDRISIHFEDKEISKALAEYYETIWEKAKPVKF